MKVRYKLYDNKNKVLLGIFPSLSEVRKVIEKRTGKEIRLDYKYEGQFSTTREYLTFVERYN